MQTYQQQQEKRKRPLSSILNSKIAKAGVTARLLLKRARVLLLVVVESLPDERCGYARRTCYVLCVRKCHFFLDQQYKPFVTMMKQIFALLAVLASASAFVTPAGM